MKATFTFKFKIEAGSIYQDPFPLSPEQALEALSEGFKSIASRPSWPAVMHQKARLPHPTDDEGWVEVTLE